MSLAPRLAAVRLLAILAVAAFGLVGRVAQAAPSQQSTAAVMIRGFKYEPAATTVAVGTVVTWTNQDTAPHTATSVTAGKFDTGTIEQNQSKSVTLNEAGTFEYLCSIHPQMRGTLTVTAAQATTAPAPQATAAAPAPQATAAAPAPQA
ncbi:MAG: cupredoxin domain-containing protein, partial [Chloroflexota bacterium]|nr:cupredoxin domain-containing protein [Chloroflexota bacterium]